MQKKVQVLYSTSSHPLTKFYIKQKNYEKNIVNIQKNSPNRPHFSSYFSSYFSFEHKALIHSK